MPQKRREAFVAAKEAPAALSALEQLVAEAAAAEAGAARTAKREALAAVQAEGRAFRAAGSIATRWYSISSPHWSSSPCTSCIRFSVDMNCSTPCVRTASYSPSGASRARLHSPTADPHTATQ